MNDRSVEPGAGGRPRVSSRRHILRVATVLPLVGLFQAACALAPAAPGGRAAATPAAQSAQATVLPTAAVTPGARPLKAMTFMAGYKPQADVSFVGPYVANDLGYFDAAGLSVTIKHSSGNGDELKLLVAKQIQVTTEVATSLIKNLTGPGLPLISLAVLTQQGDTAMATLSSSGIVNPKQFEGKIVGYKVEPVFEYLAMLKAAGVDRSKIKEVSVGFDPRILTEHKVDVLPVFKSNEPDLLRRMGFAVNVIAPEAYGVPTMGQIWMAHRDVFTADPDPYERFVKAALHGLTYAFAHPKEAIDIVMKYAPTEDRAHQETMFAVEQESAITEQTRQMGIGWQTVEQWTRLQDGLTQFGVVQRKLDPTTFFDAAFRDRLYRNGAPVWP